LLIVVGWYTDHLAEIRTSRGLDARLGVRSHDIASYVGDKVNSAHILAQSINTSLDSTYVTMQPVKSII